MPILVRWETLASDGAPLFIVAYAQLIVFFKHCEFALSIRFVCLSVFFYLTVCYIHSHTRPPSHSHTHTHTLQEQHHKRLHTTKTQTSVHMGEEGGRHPGFTEKLHGNEGREGRGRKGRREERGTLIAGRTRSF